MIRQVKKRKQHTTVGCDIICGDCLDILPTLDSGSVDSIVCDPPYGLKFMGRDWDHGVPATPFWAAALRVVKPGAYLLAFGGTRTHHRLMVAIEDAGWEIRDCLGWLYGSGFPKSHNVSKAIDKAAGAKREVGGSSELFPERPTNPVTAPATPEAKQWDGWGTALKPAWEPIIMARKPFDSTVAANVLKIGTGGINVDKCKVGTDVIKGLGKVKLEEGGIYGTFKGCPKTEHTGRWPANIIHDGSDEVLEVFPDESSRFFYCAKTSKADRDESNHPTMKPTVLMRYLCRLVTPPNGCILDPFMGAGSTGKAAMLEKFRFIGIDVKACWCRDARRRIASISI